MERFFDDEYESDDCGDGFDYGGEDNTFRNMTEEEIESIFGNTLKNGLMFHQVITSSEGRKMTWDALNELTFARANPWECYGRDIPSIDGTFTSNTSTSSSSSCAFSRQSPPSENEILDIYFGKNSQLFRVFHDELKWDYSKFVAFIATSLLTAFFNLSFKEVHLPNLSKLFGDDSSLDSSFLSHDQYVTCWNEISYKMPINQALHLNDTPFWKHIQLAFNSQTKR